MDNLEKQLDDKLAELRKTRDELIESLEKNAQMGYPDIGAGGGDVGGTGGSSDMGASGDVNKKDDHEDEEEDKKMIEEKMDEHNEKKHGEDKDEDSAMKTEVVKFEKNGQWSVSKKDKD